MSDPESAAKQIIYSNSIPEPNSGCWLWTAGAGCGYGSVWFGKKVIGAHRLSLHAFTGFDLSSNLLALHKCNNTYCVNPDHLYPGHQWQNIQDQIKAGTSHRNIKNKRKFCPQGHSFTKENTLYWNGARVCRICKRKQKQASRARLKQKRSQ